MSASYRVEGVAVALSSISHGAEHHGTVMYLRREKIVQPDGQVVEVPVVSGNAVRGVLRRASAEVTVRALGLTAADLPLPLLDFLFSGGALDKAGSGSVMSADAMMRLKRLVPHVALFAGSGGGRILEGKLTVGKMVPVCAETAHLMPPAVPAGDARTVWDLVQIEEFSRSDDLRRGGQVAELAAGSDGDIVERDTPQQMRYGAETIAAGCRLHWWMGLRDVTDLEVAQLRAALGLWSERGAHIGGRSSTGHGRIGIDIDQWVCTSRDLTEGSALPAPTGDPLAAWYRDHREEAVEALQVIG